MVNSDKVFYAGVASAFLGALIGATAQHLDEKQTKINPLKTEMKDYVFSGRGGEVSCNTTDDPITSEKVFDSKDIAPDAKLRQLLNIDIAKGTCTVKLIH